MPWTQARTDLAIVVGCWAVITAPVVLGLGEYPGAAPGTVALVGAAAAAPLVVRRAHPLTAAALVTVVLVVAELAGVRFTPWVSNAGPAFAVAVFTLAERLDRRRSVSAALVLTALTVVAGAIAFARDVGGDHDAVQLLVAVPAWLVGDAVRTRRVHRAELAVERGRQAVEHEARLRAEERVRLSRDVHDVVSHSLSGIVVRAGVARLLAATDPGQAPDALAEIESSGRAALDDLRGLLARLREPSASAPMGASLADLDPLLDGLRAGGLTLERQIVGVPRRYGPALDTAAYRIVSEALTNVVRHSGARSARVVLDHRPDALVVTVVDDGVGLGTAPAGLGRTGMRERAELLGGTLTAGPGTDGGCTVTAWLPTGEP